MRDISAALELAQNELPQIKCPDCGGIAKVVAYNKRGEPVVACSTPGCKGHWASKAPRR